MSDIEDEVKCSECPNARHGFDRDASHNEGRYVCQCESHKCPAESLRQQLKNMTDHYNAALEAEQVRYRQLVEKHVEVKRLKQSHLEEMSAVQIRLAENKDQLAASQAREQQLLNILGNAKPLVMDWCNENGGAGIAVFASIREALTAVTLDDIK